MVVEYKLYNPNKNYTALVAGSFTKEEKLNITKKILEKETVCEQVGFVTTKGKLAILEMGGGEFCGNASMCAAIMTGLKKVKCSGNDEILNIDISGNTCSLSCIILPTGINHKVFLKKPDKQKAEEEIRKETDATGYMFLDGNTLWPLVYIPSLNTLYWENSCASGSLAVAEYLYKTTGEEIDMDLNLPGGVLNVKAGIDGMKLSEEVYFERNGFIE